MRFGRIVLVAAILGGTDLVSSTHVLSDPEDRSAATGGMSEAHGTAPADGMAGASAPAAASPGNAGAVRAPGAARAAVRPPMPKPSVAARALRRPTLFDFLRGMAGD